MDGIIVDNMTYYANNSGIGYPQIKLIHKINCELTFVLDGSMTYYINDKQYIIKKNDAVLIKPGMFLRRPKGNNAVSYVSFNFTVYDNDSLTDEIHLKSVVTPFIKNIVNAFPYKNISTLINHGRQKLLNMLNIILLEMSDELTTKSQNKYIHEILTYISNNICEPLTLKDISRHVHLSEVYTSKLFKKEMNTTLIDYINKSKMEIANDMILTDNPNLKAIATHLGFSDYCYFSRLYKKFYGCSPSNRRKNSN